MIDENLQTAVLSNNLIIFVGAGCSIPLNYPSWKTLVGEILDHFILDDSASAVLDFTKLKNQLDKNLKSPLDILNLLENDITSGNAYRIKSKEIVYDLFSKVKSENNFASESHKLMWKISPKIITTNYDKILEQNTVANSNIKVFDNDNPFMALKSQGNDFQFLYKIHGDFEKPERIILFESDYKKIYTEGFNKDTLSSFFKSKTFLFIGFSLSDPFINDLFSHIKEIYKDFTVGNHFVFTTDINADFSKYDIKKIYIENWEEDLLNYLNELILIKNSPIISPVEIKVASEDSELEDESIDSLFAIVKNKTDDLKKSPSNKILASELHDLKSKINQLMYGDLDYLKSFNKEYRNTHLEMLFENIYGIENLSFETISEINRIRTNSLDHSWYERAQLVSAIACSLFIFNKADETKISILVDFINDNEENVWERSLTYLILILNHLGNKWLRFPNIKRKIHLLTLNNSVQAACQKIVEYIIVFGVDKFNLSEKIFENPFFENSPYNYFLPFFQENNPLFDNVYDNYPDDDIEDFIKFLENCPVPDSMKYVWCNTKFETNNSIEPQEEQREKYIKNHLNINEGYFPFASYIQQFVSFTNGFSQFSHLKLIDTQLKITSTSLKDYLLNDQEKCRVLGIHFMKERSYGQAIVNFEKFITLVPNDITVLDNLANCYLNQKDNDKAKNICKKLISIAPNYVSNLIRLSEIYQSEDNHEKALEIIESFDNKPVDLSILYKKAYLLQELDKDDESLACLEELQVNNFTDKYKLHNIYGLIYTKKGQFEKALHSLDKSISLHENENNVFNRASLYEKMEKYEKALEDVNRVLKINRNEESLTKKTYILMYLNKFDDANKMLRSLNRKDKSYYNTLANYYRLKGNYGEAFKCIDKAISLSNDKTFLGTKAAIYASNGDNTKFYEILEDVLLSGGKAKYFLPDIKKKYENNEHFIDILKKYNQSI